METCTTAANLAAAANWASRSRKSEPEEIFGHHKVVPVPRDEAAHPNEKLIGNKLFLLPVEEEEEQQQKEGKLLRYNDSHKKRKRCFFFTFILILLLLFFLQTGIG